jgi:imidazole glycerol phosphate synthase subunit HisF
MRDKLIQCFGNTTANYYLLEVMAHKVLINTKAVMSKMTISGDITRDIGKRCISSPIFRLIDSDDGI